MYGNPETEVRLLDIRYSLKVMLPSHYSYRELQGKAYVEYNDWELLDGNLSACCESAFGMLKLIVHKISFVYMLFFNFAILYANELKCLKFS